MIFHYKKSYINIHIIGIWHIDDGHWYLGENSTS